MIKAPWGDMIVAAPKRPNFAAPWGGMIARLSGSPCIRPPQKKRPFGALSVINSQVLANQCPPLAACSKTMPFFRKMPIMVKA